MENQIRFRVSRRLLPRLLILALTAKRSARQDVSIGFDDFVLALVGFLSKIVHTCITTFYFFGNFGPFTVIIAIGVIMVKSNAERIVIIPFDDIWFTLTYFSSGIFYY